MHDLPLFLVWPYALWFWGAAACLYWLHLRMWRAAGRIKAKQDAGTLRLMVVVGQLTNVAAVMLAFFLPATSIGNKEAGYFSGVALIVVGAALRLHCMRMLGSGFTPYVVVTSDQRVVESGAYRWVPHPSYTAGMIIMFGFGLALGNWASVLVLAMSTVTLYIRRVDVEERAMLTTLGDPYAEYMHRTKRFIPFLV